MSLFKSYFSFNSRQKSRKNIFLDYASTTPISKEVSLVMQEAEKNFANPSALYSRAILVKNKIDESKKVISDILSCQKESIIFTSGGTESNNLALLGTFEKYNSESFKPHFITTKIEHPAILEVCREIERRGGEVTYLDPNEDGIIVPKLVRGAIKENTVLVSVMYANNEIGTVQPIKEIGRVVKEKRRETGKDFPYFHTDACQAGLYLPLNVLRLSVDLMTLDGIKMYGPRGAGILYKSVNVELSPILFGGGQQAGMRSGTENLASIVGMAKALEIAEQNKEAESARLSEIRDYGIKKILEKFPKATLNGDKENRLPNNINICFPGIDSEFVTIALDVNGFSVSYSSSCRTLKEDSSSYVVESLGKKNCSLSSLRFTLGRESEKKDIDALLEAIEKVIK